MYPERTEACHQQWQDSASPSAAGGQQQYVTRIQTQGSKEDNNELVEMVNIKMNNQTLQWI